MKKYYVYMMTNKFNTVLYTGVTSNLLKRIYDHKNKFVDGFTKQYNINKLVYYEEYNRVEYALNREKQIKAGSRLKKEKLIRSKNPNFEEIKLMEIASLRSQ